MHRALNLSRGRVCCTANLRKRSKDTDTGRDENRNVDPGHIGAAGAMGHCC